MTAVLMTEGRRADTVTVLAHFDLSSSNSRTCSANDEEPFLSTSSDVDNERQRQRRRPNRDPGVVISINVEFISDRSAEMVVFVPHSASLAGFIVRHGSQTFSAFTQDAADTQVPGKTEGTFRKETNISFSIISVGDNVGPSALVCVIAKDATTFTVLAVCPVAGFPKPRVTHALQADIVRRVTNERFARRRFRW